MTIHLCECGCGETTPIARITRTDRGQVKGQPLRFINGHNRRKSGLEYEAIDCGHTTPCWVWRRSIDNKGYGRVSPIYYAGHHFAHRMVWDRHNGPIPEGTDLDHLCRNPPCVNPDHLEPVSHAVNCRRGAKAKLTDADAIDIRRAYLAKTPATVLAARYGVTKPTIYNAIKGATFGGHEAIQLQPRKPYADLDLEAIRRSSMSGRALAPHFGTSVGTISRIRRNEAHVAGSAVEPNLEAIRHAGFTVTDDGQLETI